MELLSVNPLEGRPTEKLNRCHEMSTYIDILLFIASVSIYTDVLQIIIDLLEFSVNYMYIVKKLLDHALHMLRCFRV